MSTSIPRIRVCYFAAFGYMEDGRPMPPCDGQLVRCHLIPRNFLKREGLPHGDPRTYVWGCGGPMGNGGHHGMLDHSRTLRLPRSAIPPALEEYAAEHGITWWLDRTYGTINEDQEAVNG